MILRYSLTSFIRIIDIERLNLLSPNINGTLSRNGKLHLHSLVSCTNVVLIPGEGPGAAFTSS